MHRLSLFAAAALSAACGNVAFEYPSDGGSGGSGGGGGAGGSSSSGAGAGVGGNDGGAGGSSAGWGLCPQGFTDECRTFDIPIDHDNPSGKTIEVFVSRSLSGIDGAPQLWMLQGGPGGSAEVFAGYFDAIRIFEPAIDIYTLEHRGVGDSTRLGCLVAESPSSPGTEQILTSEIGACVDELIRTWGDDLDLFSTTQAARDLAWVIDETREPGQDVFVYGVSYGTVWGHRYMQIAPDQATGVILDSIASPGASLHTFGEQWDPIADEVFEFCAVDPLCSEKLGDEPMEFIASVYDAIDAGHCPELGFDRDFMRRLNGALLASVIGRTYIAPLMYRVDRCDEADLQAISVFFNNYFGFGGMPSGRSSQALLLHIGLSELWSDDAPGLAALTAAFDASLFGSDFASYAAEALPLWPTYPKDEYVGAFADSDQPTLMMNGTLDPQTPLWMADPLGSALTGPYQTYIPIPLSPHGVISQSLVERVDDPACGLGIMMSFVAEPLASPYTKCLDHLAPIRFEGYPGFVESHWGGLDPYENTVPFSGAPQPLRLPALDRIPRGL